MGYEVKDVFKPGSFPNLTYVSRESGWEDMTYDDRLQQALEMTGFLTYIVGSSKVGKTILCKKVVSNGLVSVSGADFKQGEDIWTVIARHAGMPVEGGFISTESGDGQAQLTRINKYQGNKDEVISYFNSKKKTLLIDDFHYASEETQTVIAQQLKYAIGKDFSAIIISLPHRADEAIRRNPDLSGRIAQIELEPWKDEDLKSIASTGFDKLKIQYSPEILDYIAKESLASPQLMQLICLNIGLVLQKKGSLEGKTLTEEICRTAFRRTTSNFEYREIARLLRRGPNSRGTKRKKFMTGRGIQKDIYQLILDAMKKDPPVTAVHIEDLRNRIISGFSADEKQKLNLGMITKALRILIKMMNEKENDLFKVFDLRDDMVHILDPQFLFCTKPLRGSSLIYSSH